MNENQELPPIEEWWPLLAIPSKHALREHPGAIVPNPVLDDIARITGVRVLDGARLSQDDVQFIETQTDPVD